MSGTASVGFAKLASVIQKMPSYSAYGSGKLAAAEERAWRLALGRLLKECGDRMLRVVELQPELITDSQHDTIDQLIDEISDNFHRLNRQGQVSLPASDVGAIAELEELDLRLVILLEEAHALVTELARDARASGWFGREAERLSRDLAAFGSATEERNLLLGLDWEAAPAHTSPKGDEA